MKIYAEFEDGKRINIKEVKGLGDGDVLLIKDSVHLSPADRQTIEDNLSQRIGKRVVLLPSGMNVVGTL